MKASTLTPMSRQMRRNKHRRNVPAVHRHRRMPSVGMPGSFVRASLPDFEEAIKLQPADHFSRLEYARGAHETRSRTLEPQRLIARPLLDSNDFRADQVTFKSRLAFLQKHLHHFCKIFSQLLAGFSLRMRASKSGDIPNVRSGYPVTLENGFECSHQLPPVAYREIYLFTLARQRCASI